MADNPFHSTRPAWRGDEPTKARREPQRPWRKEVEPSGKKPRRLSKRAKIIIAATSFAAVVGAFIAILYLISPPKPTCLVLYGAPNETNLAVPHNVHGWQGLQVLAQLGETRGGVGSWLWHRDATRLRLWHEPGKVEDKTDWNKGMDNIQEKTIIVFLAMHGGADDEGAYLIKEDASNRRLLRLKTVLADLGSDKLKGKKKLLILDATQVTAHWSGGMLNNDFVARLKEQKQTIESIPNLVVLCASDENQRSWTSDEWQQTAFAHFVIEGLKGKARTKTGRITAQDLYEYVAKEVKSWAEANRDALQQPILLGDKSSAENMELVLEENAQPRAEAKNTAAAFPMEELQSAWTRCQTLRARDAVARRQ